MSGFVYIWRDRKKNRFYIGSHWGSEDDRYICSSQWMRRSYKNRPEDFKRKIVARVTTTRQDLLAEEQRWLDMIKPEEIKVRYYNLIVRAGNHWGTDERKRMTVGQKVSASLKRRWAEDPAFRKRMVEPRSERMRSFHATDRGLVNRRSISKKLVGNDNAIGTVPTDEQRARMSASQRKYWSDPTNVEKRRKIMSSEAVREKLRDARLGRKWSSETRDKIQAALQDPGVKEKMRNAKLGRKQSPETVEKRRESLKRYHAGRSVSK